MAIKDFIIELKNVVENAEKAIEGFNASVNASTLDEEGKAIFEDAKIRLTAYYNAKIRAILNDAGSLKGEIGYEVYLPVYYDVYLYTPSYIRGIIEGVIYSNPKNAAYIVETFRDKDGLNSGGLVIKGFLSAESIDEIRALVKNGEIRFYDKDSEIEGGSIKDFNIPIADDDEE